jgi:hypothetical protein
LFDEGFDLDENFGTSTNDCLGKSNSDWHLHGLSFIEGGSSVTGAADRIVYFHDSRTGEVYRKVSGGNRIPIVADDVFIHDLQFFVTGSTPQSEAAGLFYDQPSVTVYLEASPTTTTPVDERYQLQSTVTQRVLDI